MSKFFPFMLLPFFIWAQEAALNTITIESSSTVHLVADIVYFDIKMSVEDSDPQKVYEAHKKQERKLLDLLTGFSIPDSAIQYSLLTLQKRSTNSDKRKFYSLQRVKIVFKGASKYESFQIKLLENGFYEFRAGFGSSHIEMARRDGYKAALENARRDALIIAETLGKKLGRITGISTRTNSFRQLSHNNAMRIPSVQSLIEIKQTVAARTNLKVTFELK